MNAFFNDFRGWLLAVILSGCTVYRPVPVDRMDGLKEGEVVFLLTSDSTSYVVRIVQISANNIIGSGRRQTQVDHSWKQFRGEISVANVRTVCREDADPALTLQIVIGWSCYALIAFGIIRWKPNAKRHIHIRNS